MKTNFKLGQNGLLTLKGTLSTNFVNMRNYKKRPTGTPAHHCKTS